MCTKSECISTRKRIKKMNARDIEKQLETCQKCAYRKQVENWKDETYKQIRLAYVESYWENSKK